MPKFNTAYDTSIGLHINLNKTKAAIHDAFVRGMLIESNLDIISSLKILPIFVTGNNNVESNIPSFSHPILLGNIIGQKDKEFLVSDIRQYLKHTREEMQIKNSNDIEIRNVTEFNLVKSRAILNMAWLTGDETQIKNTLIFGGTVFAAWLVDNISKRFALDPDDQIKLFIISHFYYQSLFSEDKTFDETQKEKFSVHTIKASKAPVDDVFRIFDEMDPITNVESYCDNVKKILKNVRLKDLSTGFLITLIGGSWFGINSKEMLAVALEHPPTWLAIVYTALVERTFQNSNIAKIAERYGKNNNGAEFVKAFVELMNSYKKPEDDSLSFKSF